MKKLWLLTLFLALTPASGARAQSAGLSEVTLYSPIKYGASPERAFFNFQTGSVAQMCCRWDLAYGTLSVGAEHDWLQVAASNTTRTAIKDLGALGWGDSFVVPVVEPFPRLKEGEQRLIVMNADGANPKPPKWTGPKPLPGPVPPGEESLMGSPIRLGNIPAPTVGDPPGPSGTGYVEGPWLSSRRPAPATPGAPPRPATPPTTPIFAKAVVGHIYAVHVVDEGVDYYALFRVESLESGDRCTISWKLIPPPENGNSNQPK